MPVIPLLLLFHRFNSQYFENSLAVNNQPIVKVRWSDNRLKTTAGFYKRKRINGLVDSEIILSKPILSKLSISEINSTLCHEMIHAWVDRILKKNEIHGPNFLEKMHEINAKEKNFQISVRHSFPIERREYASKTEGRGTDAGCSKLPDELCFNKVKFCAPEALTHRPSESEILPIFWAR